LTEGDYIGDAVADGLKNKAGWRQMLQPAFQSHQMNSYADNANSFTNVCGREIGENKLAGKR
jgi:hypothetical protein